MDPQHSAQDIVRCDLCETPVPPMCCDICHIDLCIACVVEHLSDNSKEHKVLPYKDKGSSIQYPKCQKHPPKICELKCEQCNIAICASCISSGSHEYHKKEDMMKKFTVNKENIEKDLQELKKIIFPKYQKAATNIPVRRADVKKHSNILASALDKQGEALHTEINTIIQGMKSEIDDMDAQHIAAIDRQADAINHAITEITQAILFLQDLLDSNDACLLSAYTSRNEDFRSLPAQFQVNLPTFTPQQINREHLYQWIGCLSKLTLTYPATQLLVKPLVHAEIETDFEGHLNHQLFSLSCLSDEKIWISGNNKIIKLYNLKGELLKSVQTKSGNVPRDIAVTRSGGLMYADYSSINRVSDTQIQTLVSLRGWEPSYLCITSSGDLLVIMESNDGKQTKVVRYFGPTEKQCIQWDDQGKPLYSPPGDTKYLNENRNLDICVADNKACAVVVVSSDGKLRFRYTGPLSNIQSNFDPVGITTDSQANILISDIMNRRIHIVDKDGLFLCYIDKCGLHHPHGLYVDSRDYLFVAEQITAKVKKIKYCK